LRIALQSYNQFLNCANLFAIFSKLFQPGGCFKLFAITAVVISEKRVQSYTLFHYPPNFLTTFLLIFFEFITFIAVSQTNIFSVKSSDFCFFA